MSCSISYQLSDGKLLEYTSPASTINPGPSFGLLHFENAIASEVLYTHYAHDNKLVERPKMLIGGGVSVGTGEIWRIDGIPSGAMVRYPGGSITVDDGFIEWSSMVPGEFRFTIEKFPYLDAVVNAVISPV